MGRLIDADALIEKTKKFVCRADNKKYEQGLNDFLQCYFPQIIKDEPTAYDVEKVVEELEEYKKWYETHGCNADLNRGIIGATNHAVDLVRKGGVE